MRHFTYLLGPLAFLGFTLVACSSAKQPARPATHSTSATSSKPAEPAAPHFLRDRGTCTAEFVHDTATEFGLVCSSSDGVPEQQELLQDEEALASLSCPQLERLFHAMMANWRGCLRDMAQAECQEGSQCKHKARCVPEFPTGDVVSSLGEVAKCVATDKTCRASNLCSTEGKCSAVDGACQPTTAAHCQQSVYCKEGGLCGLDNGQCKATRTEHCLNSRGCKTSGACELATRRIYEYDDQGQPVLITREHTCTTDADAPSVR